MTHPFIAISRRYQQAQALVLKEAEAFAHSGESNSLFLAVEEMCEARIEYQAEKLKAMVEPEEDTNP